MVKVQLNHVKSLYFHMIYFSSSVYLFIFLWFVFYDALIVNFVMCILIYFDLYKIVERSGVVQALMLTLPQVSKVSTCFGSKV